MTGIHFLLTYRCTFECDHCFLYCGPRSSGTFTVEQIRRVLSEAEKIGTIDNVYFEGGEPFLYYPLMVEGVRLAREAGMKTGLVTNAYWATAREDADLWLGPLCPHELYDLSLSDDAFHSGDEEESAAKRARESAERLGIPVRTICIEEPKVERGEESQGKGEPVVGGDVAFRGRAVDKLTGGLPRKPWASFDECKREELEKPGRVHVDSFGNVQICQGLSMGNMWKRPLSEIVTGYDAKSHPICGPLLEGGPAELARTHGVEVEEGYVDECHLCYSVRVALLEKFPEYLGPKQVYGIEE
jgi:hypothetical protein